MTIAEDLIVLVEQFFIGFGSHFFKDLRANGGGVLASIVEAAMLAAEESFSDIVKSGSQKKEFAISNTISGLKESGAPIDEATVIPTINALIEIGMSKINASK